MVECKYVRVYLCVLPKTIPLIYSSVCKIVHSFEQNFRAMAPVLGKIAVRLRPKACCTSSSVPAVGVARTRVRSMWMPALSAPCIVGSIVVVADDVENS